MNHKRQFHYISVEYNTKIYAHPPHYVSDSTTDQYIFLKNEPQNDS